MSDNDKQSNIESSDLAVKSKSFFHKSWFYYLRISAMLLALVVVYYFYQDQSNYQAVSANENRRLINVSIPENSDVSEISQLLYDDKLIKSADAFVTYANIHGTSSFKSGRFSLTQDLTIADIYNQLKQDPNYIDPYNAPQGVVFIQGGQDVEAISKIVAEQTQWSEEDFRNAVNDDALIERLKIKYPDLLNSLPANGDEFYKLEGYLFPATYDFRETKSIDEVVEQMIKALDDYMQPFYSDLKKTKHNMHQVLTLASLTEKEALNKSDKEIIAGVFWNRIDKKMPLQSDVAVKYLMHNPSAVLTNDDVNIDSPYNLYKNEGFGPGPFDSPGTGSIQAVLYPKDRNKGYLFFVSNLQTGEFVFTKTYEEHDEAVSSFNSVNNSVQ